MSEFKTFIPISKIDKEKRMVWGYASTEDEDSQGEIVTRQFIEKALPDYLKIGNVREMHQLKAAGKVKESKLDNTGWFIGVKVVANDAWELVKEEVYTGFSIGGEITSSKGNRILDGKINEVSLVDRPSCPTAEFTMYKAKGANLKKSLGVAAFFANFASEIEWIISDRQDSGENTKSLEKLLSQLKQLVADEATAEKVLKFMGFMKSLDNVSKQLPMETLIKRFNDAMEGVQMDKKEVKKVDEEVEEKEEETTEETTEDEKKETEDTEEKEDEEEKTDEETEEEKEEEAEKADKPQDIAKAVVAELISAGVIKKADDKEETKDEEEKTELVKVDALKKVSDKLDSIEERLIKLEQTPVVKSKVVTVEKDFAKVDGGDKEDKEKTEKIATVTARINELAEIQKSDPDEYESKYFEEGNKLAIKLRKLKYS